MIIGYINFVCEAARGYIEQALEVSVAALSRIYRQIGRVARRMRETGSNHGSLRNVLWN